MSTITLSAAAGYVSQLNHYSPVGPISDYSRPSTTAPTCVDYSAKKPSRTALIASVIIIIALFDIVCIAGTCPVAAQLAEWAGVSLLNSVYVGLVAMVVSVPVVLVANVLAVRYWVRRMNCNTISD